jgi:NTE family protein
VKIGLALGGGGAKGLAHISALRVPETAHVPLDLITGTSAGAIVGALYAAGKSPDDIERLMRRLTLRQWLALDRTGMGMFSTDGICHILQAEVGKETRIENLPRAFACVAVDLDSQEEVVFDAGSVIDAVCASAAFPGIFAPVRIGERFFIDGGTLNPVPFDIARQRGADCVIAVDLAAEEPLFTATDPHTPRRGGLLYRFLFTAEQQKTFRVLARTIGIMTKQLRVQKMEHSPPDLVIYPQVQNVGLLDFDLIDVCLAAGESATRDALPQIQTLIAPSRVMPLRRTWRKTLAQIARQIAIHAR